MEVNGKLTRIVGAVALAATLGAGRPAAAQENTDTDTGRPWIVSFSSWAKWGALASAVGFTGVAIFRNDDANDVFAALGRFCRNAPDACRPGDDGRYVDAGAEALFQETVRLDRQARAWMVAGQITLAAAGTMFLIDLVTGHDGPRNIPFAPLEAYSSGRGVGLRLRF